MNKQQLLDVMAIRAEMRADKLMEQFNIAWNEPDPMEKMEEAEEEDGWQNPEESL